MTAAKPFAIPKGLVYEAFLAVKANAGAAGVDKETIEDFERDLKGNLYRVWNRMSSGSYFPPPVRAVAIPKKTGGERILGVPTVADRVAQTVVKSVLEPLLEPIFLPDSYGYRPEKSALDAIAVTRERCWRYDWVLEFDIRGLFDNIPHALLLKALEKHTDCEWARLYIRRWLTAPMQLADGTLVGRDAEALADALRTDRRCFRLLAPLDPVVVELREWSRIADELRVERTRLSNQVRELLWRYYPQLLELCDDVAADWVLELWRLVPTPDKARRVREATVERLLKRHHIRRITAAAALERLRAPAISVAAGTVSAVTGHIEGTAQRLALVNRQIREADKRLDRLTEKLAGGEDTAEGQTQEPRDVTIPRSLPGVGRIVLATLLTEAQHALQRRDYHALRCLSGVAPITKRSGKSKIVLMRQAAHIRLRNAVYHWARTAVQHDPRSRAKYAALRARGHGHGRALRSVADRLLACAMLQTRTLFNPSLPAKIANPRP